MYGMNNESYHYGVIELVKYLTKWRELTGNDVREPLIKYRHPKSMVVVYIDADRIDYRINMYKQTHKSKWIYKYRNLVMSIKEAEIPCIFKYIRACNSNMAKLIKRKRGRL